jgi:DNA-binding NarL/FixJ family response regulator
MLNRAESLCGRETTGARSESHPAKRKIWLVDDNQPLRRLLAEVLPEYAELEVAADFASVAELLEALGSLPHPEVLVLDVNIGLDNGVDALKTVKPLAPALPIVMLTTCFDSVLRAKAMACGASDFLLKSQPLEEIAHGILRAKPPEPAPAAQPDFVRQTEKNRPSCTPSVAKKYRPSLCRYLGGLHCSMPRLEAA